MWLLGQACWARVQLARAQTSGRRYWAMRRWQRCLPNYWCQKPRAHSMGTSSVHGVLHRGARFEAAVD